MKITNLEFGYANKIYVNDLELPETGHILICGPNGSGKSTFAKCLINYLDYEGSIFYNGQNIKKIDIMEHIFYVPQFVDNYFLLPTVREEVLFSGAKITDLDYFNLGDKLNHNPNRLSGGEKIRLIFSFLKSSNKQILILDETLNGNDEKNLKIMQEEVRKLSKSHLVLEITHHISDFDNILYIKDNEIIQLNSKEEYDKIRESEF